MSIKAVSSFALLVKPPFMSCSGNYVEIPCHKCCY